MQPVLMWVPLCNTRSYKMHPPDKMPSLSKTLSYLLSFEDLKEWLSPLHDAFLSDRNGA